MGDGVLYDERLHAFRMSNGEPEPDRPTIILHVQRIAIEAERLGEVLHHLSNMIERVGKRLGARRIAVTEPRIIRGNEVVIRGETRQQRLVHPRG